MNSTEELAGYHIGDVFDYEGDLYRVFGFGIVEDKPCLFASSDVLVDFEADFYAFAATHLPPNMANRKALEKLTKAQLIDLLMGN